MLEEPEPGRTRLIVRVRGADNYKPPFGLPRWTVNSLVPLGHFIMQRKQLLGIAHRVENGSRAVWGWRRLSWGSPPSSRCSSSPTSLVRIDSIFNLATVFLLLAGPRLGWF